MPTPVVVVVSFVFCIAVLAISEEWAKITGKRHFIAIGQWVGAVVMLFTLLYMVLIG